jgi:antitoxin component of MazEF toxin-antitoxin module
MKSIELKVARIGNSRGVRLPAGSLRRYRIGSVVLMEERSDGILLRTPGPAVEKLSWADTAREMAADSGEWADWESAIADGLDAIPWTPAPANRAAERKSRYSVKPRKGKPHEAI